MGENNVRCLIITMACVMLIETTQALSCGCFGELIGSKCYIGPEKNTWANLKKICQDLSGGFRFAEVVNQAELKNVQPGIGDQEFWIGAEQINGKYVWTRTMAPVDDSLWASGEPKEGNCVMISGQKGLAANDCGKQLWGLCEKDAT